ncbi:MAG: hypothetical protein ACI9YT_001614 [Halobacteriales archaeon]|jgi:hypothetical protein
MTVTESDSDSVPDADVPPDASPVECPHCGRPFVRERHRDLHVGLHHGDVADDEELGAVGPALDAERTELRRFRLKALIVLVVLYFGLLFTYSIVT